MANVEMVSDHRSRLYSVGGTIYNKARHQLIECPWIRSVRRSCNKNDLFLYRHRRTQKYVVASWVTKPDALGKGGFMVELETMEEHPDTLFSNSKERAVSLSYMRVRTRPVGDLAREMEKQAARAWAREVYETDQTNRQQADVAKWLERLGPKYEEAAREFKQGSADYLGDDEGGPQLKIIRERMLSFLGKGAH